jgi:hypothetical protein
MSTDQLTTLTLAYLEADSGKMLKCKRDLEEFLRQAGNSGEQIKFWMGFCLEEEGDEDGDLRSAVITDVALAGLQGYVVVS